MDGVVGGRHDDDDDGVGLSVMTFILLPSL